MERARRVGSASADGIPPRRGDIPSAKVDPTHSKASELPRGGRHPIASQCQLPGALSDPFAA